MAKMLTKGYFYYCRLLPFFLVRVFFLLLSWFSVSIHITIPWKFKYYVTHFYIVSFFFARLLVHCQLCFLCRQFCCFIFVLFSWANWLKFVLKRAQLLGFSIWTNGFCIIGEKWKIPSNWHPTHTHTHPHPDERPIIANCSSFMVSLAHYYINKM